MNASRGARTIVGMLLFATASCGDTTAVDAPDPGKAYIRYVNAMPDTLGVDFHAVDIVENSPYIATRFRDIKHVGYIPVKAGSRHFRVFLSNPAAPSASTVSQVLLDTTMSLERGAYYTLAHAGFTRAGQTPKVRFAIQRDSLPTVPAGQIAVRVINLASGVGNVDIYASPNVGGPLPATALFANAAFLAPTAYVNLDTSATLAFRVNAGGGGTSAAVLAAAVVPVGVPATTSLDALPGSTIEGSVFTVYVFSRSVAGSMAPNDAAFQVPSMAVVPDVPLRTRP